MDKGFSLIELLCVLAIISILTVIAYPSYNEYLVRTRRLDAQTALLHLAGRLEQYYMREHTYDTATLAHDKTHDVLNSNLSPGGWYTLTIEDVKQNTYQLQATPMGSQATQDTRCQSLTLSNTGIEGIAKGPHGRPTGTSEQCW